MTPLPPYDAARWQQIQDWKRESPGPAARGFAMATGPATRAMQSVIPVGALRKALDLAHGAAKRLSDQQWVLKQAEAEQFSALRARPLEQLDPLVTRVQRRAMAMAGAGGVLFGVAGGFGMVADVSSLLVLALRTIHRVACCYGDEALDSPESRLAIGIFALASANTLVEKQGALQVLASSTDGASTGLSLQDAAWRDGIERAAERELAKEAAVLSLNNLARQLGVNLGWRKAGGALPVIGAAVGGSVNAWYLYDLTRTAQFCFQERWLLERYPQLRTTAIDGENRPALTRSE